MQTILGSGGVIANQVSRKLPEFTDQIKQVSRNPKKVNNTDLTLKADLTDLRAVEEAVKDSEVAYLVAGLTYDIKIWRELWPKIMHNCIEACKKHKCKLVFFDNVYSYGLVEGAMTENTPLNPTSKKGEVRAKIIKMLQHEIDTGELNALIARAPDFYGPSTPLSLVSITVFENYAKGKSAQWMIDDSKIHSMIYTPDAGKATAILGNTDSAYNQTWHLPTDPHKITGKEFIEKAAVSFGIQPRYMKVSKFVLSIMALFNPLIKEGNEMLYQNKFDYYFDSSKFFKTFPDFEYVTYDKGIKETADSYS